MTQKRSRSFEQLLIGIRRRPTLPGRVQPSTIGAEGLNFCVRYGNRWDPFAIATGNCIVVGGLRSVIAHSSYLPKVPFFPLGVFLSAGVPFGLSPASGLLTRFGHILMCQVQCVLRFFVLPHFPRPLSHLDNCTSERRLCVSYVSLFSQTFVSVSLKSSPRPISIIKLHTLPYFHR